LRRHPRWGDAPTLDELLAKISAMALGLFPDNHPDADPASLYLQMTAAQSRVGRRRNSAAVRQAAA